MSENQRPEYLEGRWDILYRDYPEVYEEFGRIPKVPDFLDVVIDRFPLEWKVVVDVGAGTGISTLKMASRAKLVIGVEIEESMLSVTRTSAREEGLQNVRFQLGNAESLPLEDASVDAAIGITLTNADVRTSALEMELVR